MTDSSSVITCRHVLDDKKFVERLSKGGGLSLKRLCQKLGEIVHADEIYAVSDHDVAIINPPHRSLWHKLTVLQMDDHIDHNSHNPEEQKESTEPQKLFHVGLDSSLITSLVEGVVVNRSSSGGSNGSVLCIPLFGPKKKHPFAVCYLVRYETMQSVIRNNRHMRKKSKSQENKNKNKKKKKKEKKQENCFVCDGNRTLKRDGTFAPSYVDRCLHLVQHGGQQCIYRELRRKQRSATKAIKTVIVEQVNDDSILVISGRSPKASETPSNKSTNTNANNTDIKHATTNQQRKKRKKIKNKKKKQKQKKKKSSSKESNPNEAEVEIEAIHHLLTSNIDQCNMKWKDEAWQSDGWGVRHRDTKSAAVKIAKRLPAKIQEVRPVTLATARRPHPPPPTIQNLSGRRQGFMSWIHATAKAQQRKVMRLPGLNVPSNSTKINPRQRNGRTLRTFTNRGNMQQKNDDNSFINLPSLSNKSMHTKMHTEGICLV